MIDVGGTSITTTLLKPYKDTNYSVTLVRLQNSSSDVLNSPCVRTKSTNSMLLNTVTSNTSAIWETKGYII